MMLVSYGRVAVHDNSHDVGKRQNANGKKAMILLSDATFVKKIKLAIPDEQRLTGSLKLLVLIYLAAISAFQRDLAILHVDIFGIPLFVGELALALTLILMLLIVLKRGRMPVAMGSIGILLLIYLAIGAGFAVWGIASGFGLAALRDYALVYYSIFFFATIVLTSTNTQPLELIGAIGVGAALGGFFGIISFVASPVLNFGHALAPSLGLVCWLGILGQVMWLSQARTFAKKLVAAIAIGFCLIGVFLSGYRVLAGSILLSILALLAFATLAKHPPSFRLRSSILVLSIVAAIFAGVIGFIALEKTTLESELPVTGEASVEDAIRSLAARWLRGATYAVPTLRNSNNTLDPEESSPSSLNGGSEFPEGALVEDLVSLDFERRGFGEGGIQFRIDAWKKALARISSSPLVGIGYGPAAALHPDDGCVEKSSPTSNCGNAHNTFLTLALRMGIPVLGIFLAISLFIPTRMIAIARREPLNAKSDQAAAFTFAALAAIVPYAFTSLFFERPFLSPFYWVILGIMSYIAAAPAHELLSSNRRHQAHDG